MRRKPQTGDIVRIPVLNGEMIFLGQVVDGLKGRGKFYLAVFARTISGTVDGEAISDALGSPIELLALTLDGKIHAGHWELLENRPVVQGVPWPAFKAVMGTADNVVVTDHLGERRRKATKSDERILPYETTVSPVNFEFGIEALLGRRDWTDTTSAMRASRILRESEFL